MFLKILLSSFFCFHSLRAEDPEIVVKAKRIADPLYIQSSSNTEIENPDADSLENILGQIPSLTGAQGSNRIQFFQMRGIGERSNYKAMPDHSITILNDDIDYSGLSQNSNITNSDLLEVYRGPQTTIAGPSSLAGLISTKSKKLSKDFNGKIGVTFANNNYYKENISLNIPVSKNIVTLFDAIKIDEDGHIKNSYLNKKNTNGKDELFVKNKTEYKNQKFKLTLNNQYSKLDNGYDAFTHNNGLISIADRPGKDYSESLGTSLKLKVPLENNVLSQTVLSHLYSNHLYSYDEDWGNNAKWNQTPGYKANYDYFIFFKRKKRNYYLDQNLKFKKVKIGFYYKNQSEKQNEVGFKNNLIRKNLNTSFRTNQFSLYGNKDFHLSSKYQLSVGARSEFREGKFHDNSNNSFNPNEFMHAAHLSLLKNYSSSSSAYIKIGKGYKAGGFNTQSAIPLNRKQYKAESLYIIELGQHITNDNISTKNTMFLNYRDDVQVETSFQDNPNDPSSYTFYTDNGTSGYVYGFESETSFKANNSLIFFLNSSLLKSAYNNYQYGSRNLRNREFPHTPNYTFNVGFDQSFLSNYKLQLNSVFQDNFYFSNSHDKKSHAFIVVNTKINYEKNNIKVSLWGKNIFNENYSNRGYFFSNEPPLWEEKLYIQRASPRTYGIDLSYKF